MAMYGGCSGVTDNAIGKEIVGSKRVKSSLARDIQDVITKRVEFKNGMTQQGGAKVSGRYFCFVSSKLECDN